MRWSSITAVLASAVTALAHRPGSVGQRVARQQERFETLARQGNDFLSAREPIAKRQSASKFLTEKTEPFSVNGTSFPEVDFDLGESYAGLLPVGNSTDTETFFWFFPSTNPVAEEEIVIWFTGGPGCSGMVALLQENGPFNWMSGTYKPVENPWSWHHLSNVIWVDQPIGTGYDVGTPTADGEEDIATQFRGFWKNFVDTFGMHDYSIYITGESYGGMYCPYMAAGMLDQNDTEYFDVQGMLFYDGLLGDALSDIVQVPFVEYWSGLFPFNDTTRASLRANHESCGYADYLDQYLVYPASAQQPYYFDQPGVNENYTEYLPGCDVGNQVWDAILALNPCFNIYSVNAQCPFPYDPLGFTAATDYYPDGAPPIFFNRTEVKEALHVSPTTDWALCNHGVFPTGDNSLTSNVVQIPRVIDATQNVIIGHATLDMVLLMNQTMLAIQNMTWGGKLGFEERPAAPFFVPWHENPNPWVASGMGVLGTAHTERGLTYVTITLSGHEVPGFQQAAGYRHLEVLLGRIPNLQSTEPFTTDVNNTAQPQGPLGLGTGPQLYAGP